MGGTVRFTVKRLVCQGTALAVLGCLQTVGALSFNHVPAAAVGALGLTAGIVLLLTAASQYAEGCDSSHKTPKAAGHQLPAVMLPRWAARGLTAFTAWLLLLVLVRLASPDPHVTTFPDTCKPKLLGCSRVAVAQPHRTANLDPPELATTLPAAADAVRQWLHRQPRTAVLFDSSAAAHAGTDSTAAASTDPDAPAGGSSHSDNSGTVFIHARVVTMLWGFADDFFVQATCLGSGTVRLEVQGQLRLGVGDMEVNVARNVAVLGALQKMANQGQLPAGRCDGGT